MVLWLACYGMFSIAIALYVFKNITKKEFWTPKVEKWIKISCWALNVGLAGMVFITLMPVGYIQLKDALEHGLLAFKTNVIL
ncbi:nitric oxide reductase [Staphylococcus aureus]|nr:nitric oxide reductase [Staphylococcus aureus]